MAESIITVDKLGKCYTVGQEQPIHASYRSLRDVMAQKLLSIGRGLKSASSQAAQQALEAKSFWALSDVSFDIKEGEVVGIIGRNGAGKSTLLKVLSRITEPTRGRVRLAGRVASLLEVGTGFHPELTGRENIFLNGSILGMTRLEIKRKFDEIVAFAEVDRFLDTPVKRYSSGMYVRLAFAVAAHLEPEILVVDEVLAVGDADFQKKCLGKMREVGRSGRTVLLVSHNMGSIASLCQRAILLGGGKVLDDGETSQVILAYLGDTNTKQNNRRAIGNENGELLDIWIQDLSGTRCNSFSLDTAFQVVMDYRVLQDLPVAPYPNFHIYDERGQCAFYSADRIDTARQAGKYRASCLIPANFLNDGAYFVGAALTCSHNGIDVCFYERDAATVYMIDAMLSDPSSSPRFGYAGPIPGVVRPTLNWTIQSLPND